MTDSTGTTQSDEVTRCPRCGEPHPDKVIGLAKVLGASVALCRKCTAIEKRERFGITPEGGWSRPDSKFNIEVVDKNSDWTTVRIAAKSQERRDD